LRLSILSPLDADLSFFHHQRQGTPPDPRPSCYSFQPTFFFLLLARFSSHSNSPLGPYPFNPRLHNMTGRAIATDSLSSIPPQCFLSPFAHLLWPGSPVDTLVGFCQLTCFFHVLLMTAPTSFCLRAGLGMHERTSLLTPHHFSRPIPRSTGTLVVGYQPFFLPGSLPASMRPTPVFAYFTSPTPDPRANNNFDCQLDPWCAGTRIHSSDSLVRTPPGWLARVLSLSLFMVTFATRHCAHVCQVPELTHFSSTYPQFLARRDAVPTCDPLSYFPMGCFAHAELFSSPYSERRRMPANPRSIFTSSTTILSGKTASRSISQIPCRTKATLCPCAFHN